MEKSDIARILNELATLSELQGENPFKSRAYENAARSLESAEGGIAEIIGSGRLRELKGIGEAIAEKVESLATTGRLKLYDEWMAKTPPGVLEMLRIPGFGPKKIRAVWMELGLESVAALEKAAQAGKLAGLKGFGAKTEEKILAGIAFMRQHGDRRLASEAWQSAAAALETLKRVKSVQSVEVGGSLRRRRETIKDIDLLVATEKPEEAMDALVGMDGVENVIAHGPTKSSVTLAGGINADLRCVTGAQFPFALLYFTGSKEHNVAMRQRARDRGMKLNEYGLFKEDSDASIPCRDEAAVFKKLGLAWIPPELREDMGEIIAAENGALPALIEERDLRGLIHFHTARSDGKASLEEMAREAERRGFDYIGVCDHSKSAAYAGGLNEDAVMRQHEEIDALQAKFKKLRILKGIESDILADGALDYSERMLARFDLIVASVHSRFNLSREEMTKRIVRAVENPFTTILGHPSGRLLLKRDPYEFDLDAVIEAAARSRTAIEINANPHRLDLDWRHVKKARDAGCSFSIGPDAHAVDGIADIQYGVGVARKGWLRKSDVINCLDADGFVGWKKGK